MREVISALGLVGRRLPWVSRHRPRRWPAPHTEPIGQMEEPRCTETKRVLTGGKGFRFKVHTDESFLFMVNHEHH